MNSDEAREILLRELNQTDSETEAALDESSGEEETSPIPENLSSDEDDESEAVEGISNINQANHGWLYSKDRTEKYSTSPRHPTGRTPRQNLFNKQPGFTKKCLRNAETAIGAFNMFISSDIKEQIVRSTNAFIRLGSDSTKQINQGELDRFIGIILLIGLLKGKNQYRREYWSDEYGIPKIKASMPLSRFEQICAKLRFDIRNTRNTSDRLAPIRIVFGSFVQNCMRNYTPSEQVTIDEQLVTFRGRCKFRMYIPSKPGRYGIKIWALCDSKNAYLFNCYIYAGKENNSIEINQGENVVKTLTIPIYKSGRNVTTDNFFTTLSLSRYLIEQNITLVGTVRKNKPFLPIEFQSSKGKEGQVMFAFQDKVTLVKYNGKKNKSVVLLSTQHYQPSINVETGKPEIIHYYNETKGGVDTLDQIIRYHSCKRATRRWPMAVFYNMVDSAAYNAYLLYVEKNPQFKALYKNQSRREFLKILCNSLLMSEVDDFELEEPRPKKEATGRGSCKICTGGRRTKSRIQCDNCNEYVCDSHRYTSTFCYNCVSNK